MTRLGDLRQSVVSDLGPRTVHTIENGGSAGLGFGLAMTYLPAAVMLVVLLGGHPKRAGLLAVLRELVEMLKEADNRRQESYFTVAFLVCAPIGAAAGSVLSMATAAHGITIGAADILRTM